ncbi:pseudouridine synthase [Gilvimarinus xylanilyticus]|uniref:tRNA pseudouridine synthase C n=1 Tax=Gilvimarinus xylanilyticus TaxID=2944139 RepID=A0A9X2I1E0_9GAMM|nr:pseudouridine synthase [Gilvimarinus xylanilyticus]MCP8898883.1 pseudouridine synthase [Gilvimarinus xylanilyticus]
MSTATDDAPAPLNIIYRDEQLVAIDKPSGLLVHRSPIDRHETRFAIQLLRDQIGQRVYPLHRLDKPTSGVLLFALSPEIAKQMREQWESGGVSKDYLALVRGYGPEQRLLDHPLKYQPDRLGDADKKTGAVQEARTEFTRLACVEISEAVDRYPQSRYSLMHCRPLTGRKHQLRRHLKHLSHPIIGDPKYGKSVHNHFFARRYGANRLLLAATELNLHHPVTGEPLQICAPLRGRFAHLIREFNWGSSLPLAWRPHATG